MGRELSKPLLAVYLNSSQVCARMDSIHDPLETNGQVLTFQGEDVRAVPSKVQVSLHRRDSSRTANDRSVPGGCGSSNSPRTHQRLTGRPLNTAQRTTAFKHDT